jgi:7-cyano-7-deazaguanine synthase
VGINGEIVRGILLSGGIDSTALAYWLRPEVAVTVDYGQKPARGEIAAASAVAGDMGLRHEIVRVDIAHLGVGQLAGRSASLLANSAEWWPYRNQFLVTVAAMRLVSEGLSQLMLGTVASDTVHADGQVEFVDAIDKLMRLQEGQVTVIAPAYTMQATELLRASGLPKRILGWTFSCHTSEYACGQCRGCYKHLSVTKAVFGS